MQGSVGRNSHFNSESKTFLGGKRKSTDHESRQKIMILCHLFREIGGQGRRVGGGQISIERVNPATVNVLLGFLPNLMFWIQAYESLEFRSYVLLFGF